MFRSVLARIAPPLALIVVAVAAIATAAPAEAAVGRKMTPDRHAITVVAEMGKIRPVAPLDSNPATKEAFMTAKTWARVTGLDEKGVSATLTLGYQFGYPVAIAPDGVDITMHTPDLKVIGGIAAKVSPEIGGEIGAPPSASGKIGGEFGPELGAEATIIPSTDVSFRVAPGKIQEVEALKVTMTNPRFAIDWDGIHLAVYNAVGPVTVRPFARILVTTKAGVYQVVALGVPRQV